MQPKEGEYYWWQAKEGDKAELCLIRKAVYADRLHACFFNKSHISEPFWGIFTSAEIKPFGKEVAAVMELVNKVFKEHFGPVPHDFRREKVEELAAEIVADQERVDEENVNKARHEANEQARDDLREIHGEGEADDGK